MKSDKQVAASYPYGAPPHRGAAVAPNSGSGISTNDSSTFSWTWTLPAGLIAAAALMAAAGVVNRRRESGVEA